jgi:hypothetical protein
MLVKNISNMELLEALVNYNPEFSNKVILTNNVEEILKYPDRSNSIWINLCFYQQGDYKCYIDIYESEETFGDFIKFGRFLARHLGETVISTYYPNLNSYEFMAVDKFGNEKIVTEDLSDDSVDGINIK